MVCFCGLDGLLALIVGANQWIVNAINTSDGHSPVSSFSEYWRDDAIGLFFKIAVLLSLSSKQDFLSLATGPFQDLEGLNEVLRQNQWLSALDGSHPYASRMR
jgi:hypothetical protein